MQIKTKTAKSFRFRLILLTVLGIGGSLWFLYDGAIAYPKQRVRALKYLEFKEKDQPEAWKEYATEQGWSTKSPGRPKSEADFALQFIMAGMAGLFGIYFLGSLIYMHNLWIELDDNGIRTSKGKEFAFEQIVSINKKKWDSKGIAKVFYDDNGSKRRLVLDDFKCDAQTTRDIMAEIESHISHDKIFGGLPEAAKKAQD